MLVHADEYLSGRSGAARAAGLRDGVERAAVAGQRERLALALVEQVRVGVHGCALERAGERLAAVARPDEGAVVLRRTIVRPSAETSPAVISCPRPSLSIARLTQAAAARAM